MMFSHKSLERRKILFLSWHWSITWIYLSVVSNFLLIICQDLGIRRDPTPIIYPGQVNIGLLSNIHDASTSNTSNTNCGSLRRDAVQRAMAAVWAAHQANFKKDDSQELNIGVYIFDTCGRPEVAQRQIYRLLGHVGHVQTTRCSEKRIPPLFAVITEGDMDSLRIPSELLDAFGVPVISTSGTFARNSASVVDNHLSTAATAGALSRAAVSVLRQFHLLEVAVIAEDDPPSAIFEEFSREAHTSGMQALPVDHPSIVGDPDNFLASLQVVSEYGRSRLKAVVFLVNTVQALDLLKSVDSSSIPQMPWVLVTQEDLAPTILKTFKRHQLRRLQKVLLLSPETSEVPEFQEYFQQLLQEDTIKYHPLLIEFVESLVGQPNNVDKASEQWRHMSKQLRLQLQNSTYPTNDEDFNSPTTSNDMVSNTSKSVPKEPTKVIYEESDVSAVVKAVWTLAAALKTVQTRSCRRGTDCLLYLRRSLSSYVLKAARSLEYTLNKSSESSTLSSTKLSFGADGILDSVRYSLKGFTPRGDILEVGWYSDEMGLIVDRDTISSLNSFVFEEPEYSQSSSMTSVPGILSKYEYHKEKFNDTISSLSIDNQMTTSTEVPTLLTGESTSPNTLLLEDEDFTSWKILDDSDAPRDFSSTSAFNSPHPTSTGTFLSPLSTIPDNPLLHSFPEINDENHVFINHLQDIHRLPSNSNESSKIQESEYEILLNPSHKSEQEHPSSNLRSISLTSHQEPRTNNGYRESKKDLFQRPEQRSEFNDIPLARANIDRSSANFNPNIFAEEDVKVISSSRNLHISSWLARPWALTVLGLCGFGTLVTLYVLVFLMVKSCEGSLKKTNTCVAVAQLVALLLMYVAAALFTWKPSELLCGMQRLVPNVSYAFCFGCLLLKGMHLRAQNSLGLGGSVNRCNQMLTLLFIVGVQVALEAQWWFIRPPRINPETLQCIITKEEILESQGYVSFLLLLGTIIAICSSKVPYSQHEGRSLVVTNLTCLLVFLSWDVACWLLPDSNCRNIAAPSAIIITAIVVLVGIFGPQLFTIHKYGGFPHKPLSYADSLSTVFTMFKDLDNASNSGTTGRGKKTAKTLETPFVNEIGEGTRNPLYSDYQSAYP